jgi:alkylated DNA repair dioxygenase AlkB
MFSYLKAMYHQSKIQAELKAQIHEKTTVNAICHHLNQSRLLCRIMRITENVRTLFRLQPFCAHAYLKDESVPMVLRKTAWRLLNERYQRIVNHYRIENLLVADFNMLEEHDELAE